MATLDLGKIKQVWRGTYNNGTAYTVDDLVAYTDTVGGLQNTSTYICVTNTTGNAPASAGTVHGSWNLVAQGVPDRLPSQSGNSGKFLKTDGSAVSFDTVVQDYTAFAIFQYSHNSSFRSYSSEISFSGNPNLAQIQFNMVYDAGGILTSSGSNKFQVSQTGFYIAKIHWTSHLPAHFRWPYLYNRTNSKVVGAPPTGTAMDSLTSTQHNMVCYQTGQGGGSTFGEPYYLDSSKEYDWRYSSDGNENSFSTSTSYLSGSYSGHGSVTQQNVVFRAELTRVGT